MTPKLCKYGCGTMLEGFDEENRKFLEAGTGGLHTMERCKEAKAKLEAKNDHGNESFTPIRYSTEEEAMIKKGYVDHTLAKDDWAFQIFTDPTPEGLILKYNNFRKEHKVNRGQYHPVNALYTIAVWYEETKQ